MFISPRLSLKIAALALFVLALIVVLSVRLLTHAASAPLNVQPAVLSPHAEGTFTPTKAQWQSFQLATVSDVALRSEEITDGLIVTNDNATVNVFSPYSGRVSRLYVALGDQVKKGTPMMGVEATEFVQGQNDLITTTSALNTARAQAALAERTEARQHDLLLAKAGAQKDWLQSQADALSAKNAVRTSEIALSAARNRLRILGRSDAEISHLETAPDTLALHAEALVVAPISGTIVQKQVGLGQFLQSAATGATTALYAIADLSTVWMVGNLRETSLAAVHLGQSVEVRVLAYPDRVFQGKLTWISPSIDPLTHRLAVRAQIANTDGALKPQMFADFTIITATAANARVIPQSAVIVDGIISTVFVARADGSLQARVVHLGRQSGNNVEVLDGLSNGERVVISGALFIDRAVKAGAA